MLSWVLCHRNGVVKKTHINSIRALEKRLDLTHLCLSQTLIMTTGGVSMNLHVLQKDVKKKYGATWTRKTPTRLVIYESMQSNVGEQRL